MKKLALLLVLFAFAACSDPVVEPDPIDESGLLRDTASEPDTDK